ncbi:hypothetical protein AAHA92_15525 [Salvia divinorum]|uniref:Uncharacterized protein n=1 Tax=Salvia divinorum TaxID=28513 RepID=A0ABD1HJ10_SALDI
MPPTTLSFSATLSLSPSLRLHLSLSLLSLALLLHALGVPSKWGNHRRHYRAQPSSPAACCRPSDSGYRDFVHRLLPGQGSIAVAAPVLVVAAPRHRWDQGSSGFALSLGSGDVEGKPHQKLSS